MKQVLLVKLSSMGDVIHTLPALTDAVSELDGIQFDWVIEEDFADIASMHPAVKRVIPIALRQWRTRPWSSTYHKACQQAWRSLRLHRYDLIIDAQGLLKSAIVARMAKGPIGGYTKDSCREYLASVWYHQRVPVSWDLHAITRIRYLFADLLQYPYRQTEPDYGLICSDVVWSTLPERFIVHIHGTSRSDKLWPVDRWVEIARQCIASGYTAVFPWYSAAEQLVVEHVKRVVPSVMVLPKLRLNVLATVLMRATGAIAVDTGLGHLCAALGVPTVSLYGLTDRRSIGTIGLYQSHGDLFTDTPCQVFSKLQKVIND